MSTPVRASDQDLRALAAIVSQDRPDLPHGEGLPQSLLADLMDQVQCEGISLERYDTGRRVYEYLQSTDCDPGPGPCKDCDPGPSAEWVAAMWVYHDDCQSCSYPERTGDLRSVVKTSDFYSARQWRSTGMYTECIRPQGIEHHLMLALPQGPATGPGQYVRLCLHRGPGPDFSERDRAVLTLLRPHLHQAYLDAGRRRHPVPPLTSRQVDLLHLVADGRTNAQIARQLGLSEGTVRTHMENIYGRLQVSSRTAAVLRAFPDQLA